MAEAGSGKADQVGGGLLTMDGFRDIALGDDFSIPNCSCHSSYRPIHRETATRDFKSRAALIDMTLTEIGRLDECVRRFAPKLAGLLGLSDGVDVDGVRVRIAGRVNGDRKSVV